MATYGTCLEALADPTRREILERLRLGPRSVGSLADDVPVSRPAVSQHLKILEEAGLVSHIVEGTRHIYDVEPDGVAELRAYVEQLWDDSLARFKHKVEREKR